LEGDRKIFPVLLNLLSPLRKANWKIIFLSLTTATVFWFFNALNKEYTTRLTYPVEFAFNRDSLMAAVDLPGSLPLNVTGGGWNLLKRSLSAGANPIRIDLVNPLQTRFITARNLMAPVEEQLQGLTVNYIAIDTLQVKIEPIMSRLLRITVDSAGIPLQDNYTLVSPIRVEPDTIRFTGPASMIRTLPEVLSITLQEQAIARDYRRELSLDLFSPTRIRKSPDVIRVDFEVDRFVDQVALVPVVPVNFEPARHLKLEKQTVMTRFQLLSKRVGKFSLFDIAVIADYNSFDRADSTVTLEIVTVPPYVRRPVLQESKIKLIHE
jgi:hypothetical protein